ncbi:hypothetical protein MPTK1_2g04210 [Marchantia polymorpha subsp. ruderalis]|uniref:Uncharacterized protein n=1 Tax=Marchantia polymorpha TaxID=3197 RepID=A0A2R6X7N4_MARPO|nr:hypothetical protein MARPO_0031s0077 [Marchantia polymorpha]BBN01054.1 hypothetical protein Mp_2g04210 [Marchantia polymorpha subsp. ruderalis]|eukprot:PTQ42103.1 hypothetical protein MARPO_0031s0077 [Marchantia polymorpha]
MCNDPGAAKEFAACSIVHQLLPPIKIRTIQLSISTTDLNRPASRYPDRPARLPTSPLLSTLLPKLLTQDADLARRIYEVLDHYTTSIATRPAALPLPGLPRRRRSFRSIETGLHTCCCSSSSSCSSRPRRQEVDR